MKKKRRHYSPMEMEESKNIPNSITIKIQESQTLSNLLVDELNRKENCEFACFKKDHPKNKYVEIMFKSIDSEPKKLLKDVIENISNDIDDIMSQLSNIS